jgi:hypothetical protein
MKISLRTALLEIHFSGNKPTTKIQQLRFLMATTPAAPAPEPTTPPDKIIDRPLTPEEEKWITEFVSTLPREDEPLDLVIPPDATTPPKAPSIKPVTEGCVSVEKEENTVSVSDGSTTFVALVGIVLAIGLTFFFWNFVLMGIGMKWDTIGQTHWRLPIALLITCSILIPMHEKVWTRQDPKKGKVFADSLVKNKLVIFIGEVSLKPFWFNPFEAIPEIDFLKDEPMKGSMKLRDKDGNEWEVEYELLKKPALQCIDRYLSFEKETVISRTKAVLEDRLNQVFALNGSETLSKHRNQALDWGASIFGHENELTEFEQHHGMLISNPKLTKFEPTADSKAVMQMLTTARILGKIIRQLHKDSPDMDSDTLQRAALRIMGVQGFIDIKASPGVHTVIGDTDGVRGRI